MGWRADVGRGGVNCGVDVIETRLLDEGRYLGGCS